MLSNAPLSWKRLLLMAGLGLVGCVRPTTPPGYPRDPLLMSKKPVEGSLTETRPLQVAGEEPPAPGGPPALLAQQPPGPSTGTIPRPTRGSLVGASGANRRCKEDCGHGPEHRWLQGFLERHPRRSLHLRYCEPSVWDSWGGKVCFEDESRLAPFADGELLVIEGEIVYRDGNQPVLGPELYPRYRIHSVKRISDR